MFPVELLDGRFCERVITKADLVTVLLEFDIEHSLWCSNVEEIDTTSLSQTTTASQSHNSVQKQQRHPHEYNM